MEQIHSEIKKLEIKIRKKISNFDTKQENDEIKFKLVYKNILNLSSKRKQLLTDLNEHIINIEQNDLIKLNKVIEFNKSKLNNANFLKEFSKLVDELETIHLLLNECVQHEGEKQYDQFVTKIKLIDTLIRQLQESLEKNCYSFDNKMYDVFSKEMNSILRKMHQDRDYLNKKRNYDLKNIWDQNLIFREQEEGFLNKKDEMNFSNSTNLNAVTKLCSCYLIKAREIIKKELLPTKEVGANYLIENRLNTDSDINQTLYSFPKCKISISTDEFVQVLKEIFDEIKNGSKEHRKDLYLISRKLCELYVDVSLIKHKKKLTESVSHAAIFHNNCFYLAHEIIKLSNEVIFTEEYCFEEEIQKENKQKEVTDKQVKIDEKLILKDELNVKIDQKDDNFDGWDLDEDEKLNLDDLNLDNSNESEQTNETINQSNDEANPSNNDKKVNVKNIDITLNLVDFIPLLRDVGSEQILNQMKKQKQFILDTLQNSRIMQNLLNDQNKFKGEYSNHPFQKAINQVLDKIFCFRDEILDLLSCSIVTRITCTLLNTLIQEVVYKILNLNDIPECNCNILLSALNFIEDFLNEREELQKLIIVLSDYHKLLEMKFVLKANLQELSDRWDNGEGPLSLAFSPDQLKHMIRALFQNTERRAALLSKIK